MTDEMTVSKDAWMNLNTDLSHLERRVQIIEDRSIRVGPWLKGMRTKIVGWLSALPMVTLASGLTIDPASVAVLIEEHGMLLAGVQVALSAGVHYYRNQARGQENGVLSK